MNTTAKRTHLKSVTCKRSVLILTAYILIMSALLTGCASSEQKLEKAQTNAAEANTELNNANTEYLADVEKYRIETADKIAANDKSIAEFKARIEIEKSIAEADYERQIIELEQKNSDSKKKMDEYKAEGKEQWEAFKTELSHDMDELSKAFTDLTVKNVE